MNCLSVFTVVLSLVCHIQAQGSAELTTVMFLELSNTVTAQSTLPSTTPGSNFLMPYPSVSELYSFRSTVGPTLAPQTTVQREEASDVLLFVALTPSLTGMSPSLTQIISPGQSMRTEDYSQTLSDLFLEDTIVFPLDPTLTSLPMSITLVTSASPPNTATVLTVNPSITIPTPVTTSQLPSLTPSQLPTLTPSPLPTLTSSLLPTLTSSQLPTLTPSPLPTLTSSLLPTLAFSQLAVTSSLDILFVEPSESILFPTITSSGIMLVPMETSEVDNPSPTLLQTSPSTVLMTTNAVTSAPLSTAVTSTPLSTAVTSTPLSTAVTSTPLSTAITSTPLSTAITSTPLSTAVTSTPLSTAVTSTPLSTAITSTPLSTAITSTPLSTAITSTPLSTAITSTPLSTAVTSTPLSTAVTSTPLSTAITSTPLSTAITSTPLSTAITSTPLSTAVTSTPLSTAVTSTPLSTAVTSTPLSTAATSTPLSTAVTSTPLSTAATSTPRQTSLPLTMTTSFYSVLFSDIVMTEVFLMESTQVVQPTSVTTMFPTITPFHLFSDGVFTQTSSSVPIGLSTVLLTHSVFEPSSALLSSSSVRLDVVTMSTLLQPSSILPSPTSSSLTSSRLTSSILPSLSSSSLTSSILPSPTSSSLTSSRLTSSILPSPTSSSLTSSSPTSSILPSPTSSSLTSSSPTSSILPSPTSSSLTSSSPTSSILPSPTSSSLTSSSPTSSILPSPTSSSLTSSRLTSSILPSPTSSSLTSSSLTSSRLTSSILPSSTSSILPSPTSSSLTSSRLTSSILPSPTSSSLTSSSLTSSRLTSSILPSSTSSILPSRTSSSLTSLRPTSSILPSSTSSILPSPTSSILTSSSLTSSILPSPTSSSLTSSSPTSSILPSPTSSRPTSSSPTSSILPSPTSSMQPSPPSSSPTSSILPSPTSSSPTSSILPSPTSSSLTSSILPSLSTILSVSIVPSPTTCPSVLSVGVTIPSTSLVDIELALTNQEHSDVSQSGSDARCELENALSQAVTNGLTNGRVKRQTNGGQFDADVIGVGDLSMGTAVVTFYVVNTSSGLPMSAEAVVRAFIVSSPQEINSHPVIIGASPNRDSMTTVVPVATESIVIPLVAGVGAVIVLLLIVILISLCVFALWNKSKSTITVRAIERGDQTFGSTNDFETFHRPTVSMVTRGDTVTLSHLARGSTKTDSDEQHDKDVGSDDTEKLFENVAHYSSPPLISPRGLKLRQRRSVAPSPSTSSQHSLVPDALKPQERSEVVARKMEANRLREEALRLQEEREVNDLRARRKATLQRMLVQSGQPRKRRKRATVVPLTDSSFGRQEEEIDTAMPSSQRSKKRRWLHRKVTNQIAPMDAPDHRPKRLKSGRSHRGRPLTSGGLPISGRVSRGVAEDVTRELAWMNTGNGVQLMSIQPIAAPTRPPPVIWDRLPAMNSPSYNERQLETYLKIHQDMEKLQLDGPQANRHDNTQQPSPYLLHPVYSSAAMSTPMRGGGYESNYQERTPHVARQPPVLLTPDPSDKNGHVVWTPNTQPTQSQTLSADQLTQLRTPVGFQDYGGNHSYQHWVDPFHTPGLHYQ